MREAAEKRAESGKEAAEKLKKEAWSARFGAAAGQQVETTQQQKSSAVIHGDADAAEQNMRVITDFGSRENSAVEKVQVGSSSRVNDDDDNSNQEQQVPHQSETTTRAPEQYVFRVNTSDMEYSSSDQGTTTSRAATSGMEDDAEGSN